MIIECRFCGSRTEDSNAAAECFKNCCVLSTDPDVVVKKYHINSSLCSDVARYTDKKYLDAMMYRIRNKDLARKYRMYKRQLLARKDLETYQKQSENNRIEDRKEQED